MSGFVESVLDLLSAWGGVSARRMFGGHGLFRQGRMFALVFGDVLYFKVGPANRPDFDAAGTRPFTYARKRNPATVTSYWEAPAELFDDSSAMTAWARKALDAAQESSRSRAAPTARGRPARRTPPRRKP